MEEEVYTGAYMQKLLEPNADFTLYISKSIKLFLNEPDDANLKVAIENVLSNRIVKQEKMEEKETEGKEEEKEEKKKEKKEEGGSENTKKENKQLEDEAKVITKKKEEEEQEEKEEEKEGKESINVKNEKNEKYGKQKGSCNENNNEQEKGYENMGESAEENTNADEEEGLEKESLKKELAKKISFVKGYHYFHKIGFSINQLLIELLSTKKDFLLLHKQANDNFQKLKHSKKKNLFCKKVLDKIKEKRKRNELYEQLSAEIQKLDDVKSIKTKQKQHKESIKNIKRKIKKAKHIASVNDTCLLKTLKQLNHMITSNFPTESICYDSEDVSKKTKEIQRKK